MDENKDRRRGRDGDWAGALELIYDMERVVIWEWIEDMEQFVELELGDGVQFVELEAEG